MEKLLRVENKSEFLKFLDAISKINDSGVIFDIKEDKITSLVSSIDSTLILYSELNTAVGFENTLNVPDVKKLRNVLDTIEDDNINLTINPNNIQYNGSGVKFKYHLYEEGFITRPNIGSLMVELTDRARHNTDNFTIGLGEVDFTLDPIPLNLDNVRLLTNINDEFVVKVNTEYGVVVFDIEDKDTKLKYIISALTQ